VRAPGDDDTAVPDDSRLQVVIIDNGNIVFDDSGWLPTSLSDSLGCMDLAGARCCGRGVGFGERLNAARSSSLPWSSSSSLREPLGPRELLGD
jgi:hypothetical protein